MVGSSQVSSVVVSAGLATVKPVGSTASKTVTGPAKRDGWLPRRHFQVERANAQLLRMLPEIIAQLEKDAGYYREH